MLHLDHSSVSDPTYTRPGLTLLTLKSSYLQGRGDVSVYVPTAHMQSKDLPTVVLLHGVYGSHWAWLHHMGVDGILEELIGSKQIPPMALIMPSDGLWGDGSGYFSHDHRDFEKWITKDVVGGARHFVNSISTASPLFITGLSMGGYGAMRLGARNGEVFSAFSGLSSITNLTDLQSFIDEPTMKMAGNVDPDTYGLFATIKDQDGLRPFRFDCGTEDPLISSNRRLHQDLVEAGIDHVYKEHTGDHEASYWREHVGDSLRFFAEHLP